MNKILSFREYFQRKYGAPVQRIPVNAGFSCPNRVRGHGCAFCDASGSLAAHLKPGMNIREQIGRGIEYVSGRYGAKPPYALYFQAFTGTNAPPEQIRRVYTEALQCADFSTLIVATRPDCLPPETIRLLAEFNRKYEVWIELGVQTANDDTLDRIGRGHHFSAVKDAVRRLHEHGIRTAAHVILGLPGETEEDFTRTADELAKLPFSGIKTHNLLILKDTPMERMFHAGKVHPMDEYGYANALAGFLRRLPEDWIVMRLCADAPAEKIIAPHWWMDKSQFTDMFLRMYGAGSTAPDCMKAVRTGDGSYTFYHPRFRQHFHSTAGAWEESVKKYLEPCGIGDSLRSGKDVSILDVGFGMGFNVCAAAELARSIPGGARLSVTTLEYDENTLAAALRLPERKDLEIIASLKENGFYGSGNFSVRLIPGDARQTVSRLDDSFDAVFLDGFTPETNPELWSLDFLEKLKQRMKPDALLASYCGAYPVKGALIQLGFHLYETRPFGRRRGGTAASLRVHPELDPMPEKELLIAERSTAGVPYRDPELNWTRERILEDRTRRAAELRAQGMPKWYRSGAPN